MEPPEKWLRAARADTGIEPPRRTRSGNTRREAFVRNQQALLAARGRTSALPTERSLGDAWPLTGRTY